MVFRVLFWPPLFKYTNPAHQTATLHKTYFITKCNNSKQIVNHIHLFHLSNTISIVIRWVLLLFWTAPDGHKCIQTSVESDRQTKCWKQIGSLISFAYTKSFDWTTSFFLSSHQRPPFWGNRHQRPTVRPFRWRHRNDVFSSRMWIKFKCLAKLDCREYFNNFGLFSCFLYLCFDVIKTCWF